MCAPPSPQEESFAVTKPSRSLAPVGLALIAALALTACGKDKKKSSSGSGKPAAVSISVAPSGKTAKYTVPSTIKGGLVAISFKNTDKMPHAAQLVRFDSGHTAQEALKIVGSESNKTPSWLHAEGGVAANPGQTGTGVLNLAAGQYLVTDLGGPGSTGPPANAEFKVTSGPTGSLPSTPITITGANPGKDKYEWQVTGDLKAGENRVTFDSKGKEAIHFIGAFMIKGNHSNAEIIKGLKSNGPPPAFVDQSSFVNTAVLDGGKSQTLGLTLRKPGKYVLFCPLTDRDGGKEHFEEGMLKTITVK